MKRIPHSQRAFTRTEVIAVIGLVFLLFLVTFAGHADNRGRSQKLLCMDNLRQIGEGIEKWRFEHADLAPWHVYPTNGGTKAIAVGLPWIEFTCLSNFVTSPRILACPADARTLPKTASNWGTGQGGFQNSGYRNNSVSYTVGLHSYFNSPREFLSSDRHLMVDGVNTACGPASIPSGVAVVSWSSGISRIAWTNEVHGLLGNILITDGSVNEIASPQLKSFVTVGQDDSGSLHLLIP